MFTHAAIVFKFLLRVRARGLSEACQNQTLVNEERSLARLSDAPHQPSSFSQKGILPCSSGTYSRQLGVNRMARRSARSGLCGNKKSLQPRESLAPCLTAFHSKQMQQTDIPTGQRDSDSLCLLWWRCEMNRAGVLRTSLCSAHLHTEKE